MIRFNCPNCGRESILPDAMAHLPLLCKGCGQRLIVPDPQPEPPPPPPAHAPAPLPPTVPAPVAPVLRPTTAPLPPPEPAANSHPAAHAPAPPAAQPVHATAPLGQAEPEPFFSPEAMSKLDLPLEVSTPAATPNPGVHPAGAPAVPPPAFPKPAAKPAPPVAANSTRPDPPASRRIIAVLADVVAVLILLAVGAMVGEVAARKSTREILTQAGSAARFPPVDLLLWLGSVAVFGLVYLWLGTRGWTVGAWLKRRA